MKNFSWRAVEAFGLAAGVLAASDAEFVRGHLRRLVWLLNDESGSIGWRAAEALGDATPRRADVFAGFIPILFSFLDMEAEEDSVRFRPGVLWGIGRLAENSPQACQPALPSIRRFLSDPEPQVRGLSAWCLGFGGSEGDAERLNPLNDDHGPVNLYEDGVLKAIRVSEVARRSRLNLGSRQAGPSMQGVRD